MKRKFGNEQSKKKKKLTMMKRWSDRLYHRGCVYLSKETWYL